MRRIPLQLLLVCLLAVMPVVASGATIQILGNGPFVAGSDPQVIVEVSSSRGPVHIVSQPAGVVVTSTPGPGRNQFTVTVRLRPSPTPYTVELLAVDSSGRSQPSVLTVSPGLRPVLGQTSGTLVAGERSRLLVRAQRLQPPLRVFLDGEDVSAASRVETDVLIVEPFLTSAGDCGAVLKVVNASQFPDSIRVRVADGPPVITAIDGNVIGGQASNIVVEGKRFASTATVFVDAAINGRRVSVPAAVTSAGENRLSLTVQMPAAASPYSGQLRITNRCAPAATHPLQVKVPQNVQPAIASITAEPIVADAPVTLTVRGSNFLPAMQVFVGSKAGGFREVKGAKILNGTGVLVTLPALDPTVRTLTIQLVNPGDATNTNSQDVVLARAAPPPGPGL